MSKGPRPLSTIGLATFALILLLRAAGYLAPAEHWIADARARILQHEVPTDIVIVGIDAQSLADLQRWPWPRRYHARALETIAQADPRNVFIDVDFSARTDPDDDALLEAALDAFHRSPVILPTFLQTGVGTPHGVTRPLDSLARHASLAGVNFQPDADGLIRSLIPLWDFAEGSVPAAASVLSGVASTPKDPVALDFSIAPSSFAYLSYVDLLAGRVDPAELHDQTVMIGATALELGDIKAVPVHRALPGVVVQALAAQTLREGPLRSLPDWLSVIALALLTAGAVASFARHGWRRNLFVLGAGLALLAALNVYAYAAHRTVLEFVPALLALSLTFVAATVRSLDQETMRAVAYALGIRRRDALLGSVAESSTDAILVVDHSARIEMANAAAAAMFRREREALLGATVTQFVPLPSGEPAAALATLAGTVSEYQAVKHDGTSFPVEISVSPVGVQGEALWTMIVRDITARKAQQLRLHYEATHDSLTDLPNRPALMAHLSEALTRAGSDGRVALLMLDLCRFKEVNDTLGHEVGDQVLREVAIRFAAIDHAGFVARLGGDEFTMVLEHSAHHELVQIADVLHESLREPIAAAGIAIDVGVSIGIARYPHDAPDAATLLRHADVAMYAAKRRQTRFEIYDAASDRNSVRRLAMVGELRNAIAAGQLRLHYQPQVNFRNGRCETVEALMRWQHPEHGFVSPAELILVAESTDLIRPLTEWTLVAALSQAEQWCAIGLDLRIAVNLSARLLQDTDFPVLLEGMLAARRLPGAVLELELTESAMMYDSERALRLIRDIHALGVALAIDDFGTGFSSLAYLRELPVHALKLDKSFVTHLHLRAEDRSIVNSTVHMAHELGLKVVAEGVETDWTARYLAQAGYDYGQGYRFSAALPHEDCRRWVCDFNAAAALDTSSVQQLRAS